MLQVLRTLNEAKIQTVGDLVFVGTEKKSWAICAGEGAVSRRRIDGFISVDGVQVWRVVHAATRRRYKVAFVGPGGHSFSAFGLPSATHAMGRAIAKIRRCARRRIRRQRSRSARTGAVNAIAAQAELLDMLG